MARINTARGSFFGHADGKSGPVSSRVVIIARSAGVLARAARCASYEALVIDAYGDQDTLSAASDYRRLNYLGNKIDAVSLFEALEEFDSLYGRVPILWGSGWEASAHILAALAATREVLGSSFRALAALANPIWDARLRDGQPPGKHRQRVNPDLPSDLPSSLPSSLCAPALFENHPAQDMLVKGRARAGGHAVRKVAEERFLSSHEFFQTFLVGHSISALCIADGDTCSIVGWSKHFRLQSSSRWPFRHSGAVTMPRLSDEQRLREELSLMVKTLGLFGLFGCDFIENENGELRLVDLNPRVPATTPLHLAQSDILNLHFHPKLGISSKHQAAATAVMYADVPIRIPKKLDWPTWTSDLPNEVRTYQFGEPLCTLWSSANDPKGAKNLLNKRLDELMAMLGLGT